VSNVTIGFFLFNTGIANGMAFTGTARASLDVPHAPHLPFDYARDRRVEPAALLRGDGPGDLPTT
jgi:hypothetical protein